MVARGETSGRERLFSIRAPKVRAGSVRTSSAQNHGMTLIQTFYVWLPSMRISDAKNKWLIQLK